MYNLKIYQICHDLIAYFATLTSPKKSQLGLIFRTGGSIIFVHNLIKYIFNPPYLSTFSFFIHKEVKKQNIKQNKT